MVEPLVTVVVPIYNVEKSLCRCVDSILNQTYRNLEIILVDDGSPDNCPAICDEYAAKDNRVKVIHKENAGLGFARNTGIENANGKYISFFDSDDYVESTTIEECVSLAQKENADLVCFGHVEETTDGNFIVERLPRPIKNVFVGDEIKNHLMPMTLAHDAGTGEDWNLSLSAWCELYSMDVINRYNWRFVSEREIISEDIYSVLEFYSYVDKVVFLNKPFYHYVSNPESLSKSYRTDRYSSLKFLAKKLVELSEAMGIKNTLDERIKTIFLGLTLGTLKQIVVADETFLQRLSFVKNIVKDDYMQKVLTGYNYSGENIFKRCLFWSIKNKHYLFSYMILRARCILEKR